MSYTFVLHGGRNFFLHGVSQPLLVDERIEKRKEKRNKGWGLFCGVKVLVVQQDERIFP